MAVRPNDSDMEKILLSREVLLVGSIRRTRRPCDAILLRTNRGRQPFSI